MRAFLLCLMIVLLPLRVWAVDVMAVQQTGQARPTPQEVAPAADCHQAMEHSAPAHALQGPASHHEAQQASDASDDCGSCSACQLCHTVALATPLPTLRLAEPATSVPRSPLATHPSATRAPGFKPPIS